MCLWFDGVIWYDKKNTVNTCVDTREPNNVSERMTDPPSDDIDFLLDDDLFWLVAEEFVRETERNMLAQNK